MNCQLFKHLNSLFPTIRITWFRGFRGRLRHRKLDADHARRPDLCLDVSSNPWLEDPRTQLAPSGDVKMAIENGTFIVDLPIKDGDFPLPCQFPGGFFWDQPRETGSNCCRLWGESGPKKGLNLVVMEPGVWINRKQAKDWVLFHIPPSRIQREMTTVNSWARFFECYLLIIIAMKIPRDELPIWMPGLTGAWGLFRISCAILVVPFLENALLQKVPEMAEWGWDTGPLRTGTAQGAHGI